MIKKIYSTVITIILISSLVDAQSKSSDNLFLKKLPNGLDVLVVEDHSVPLATIMMTFKSGAITESEKSNGLTALYQNMLYKGNKDYADQTDFNYRAGGLGIQESNSTTNYEYGKCYFTLPTVNLEAGLDYLNSAVRFAKMDPEELEKEKSIEDDQLKEKESGPFYALSDAMDQHLWGKLYSRKNPIGTHEVIKSATAALMDSVRLKYYYPNNALLIVGGDVSHENVFILAEKIYGSWKPSDFDPFKKWPIPEFKPLDQSDYFIVESANSRTPVIMITWHGPDTRKDVSATFAADVFSYLINQKLSKFNQSLVQSGLASSTNINYLTLKHVGPITLIVMPNPSKIRECVREVEKQISLMDDDAYLTDDQIQTAKRMLEIKKIRQEDITSDYVHTLSFWWASASLGYFRSYNDNLGKVSRADIKAYVQKYIKNRPHCAALLLNPDTREKVKPETFFNTSEIIPNR
jgi:zinc protease